MALVVPDGFRELLYNELAQGFRRITSSPAENYYAFALYASSGFASIAVASSSEESVEENESTDPNCRFLAFEWRYFAGLPTLSTFVQDWRREVDDNADAKAALLWKSLFVELCVECLTRLKSEGLHLKSNCSTPFFWSVQFSDPTREDAADMESVSNQLNDPQTHQRFLFAISDVLQ